MKKNIAILVAAVCLALGCVLGYFAGTYFLPKIQKDMRNKSYTLESAQKKYSSWEKDRLVVKFDGVEKTLSDYENEHQNFAIFFWATWCPYCKDNLDFIKSMAAKSNIIGMPFDDDSEYFNFYVEKKSLNWGNIVKSVTLDGSVDFVPREDSFDVQLIPSVWIIKNGSVEKIIVGSKNLHELETLL